MTTTGSAAITGELRRRILSGELAPGERVPSTRAITREWGVAIATASRVLAALQAEGLVRAVPGVGTVVAAPADPSAPTEPGVAAPPWARSRAPATDRAVPEPVLTPERIVGAAVRVADVEGLTAVSMRRVAADLGVVPMALYRHVGDKDDLVVRMLDAALGEWRPPVDAPAGWRPRVEVAVRALWAGFRRHPWLAHALSITRPQLIPAGMAYSEWVLSALDPHLEPTEAFDVHLMLINFVRGTAVGLESERDAEAASGLDNEEWMAEQEPALLALVSSGDFPHLQRMVSGEYDLDVDALFERGLRLLLDGLAVQFDRSADASRTAAPPWTRA
ncbi:TetR/AcrR family transcriptional regulator C-terminal domain-containing protein [Pseudonocardia petroleophila]|uniref:TetR/AcrR family transcriptional regulator C-terminal domain-containing protein n=1 Tax=Pseudonocardia petroleophila TaxID=37331 RepID=A0A7G7ME49_9PSEU|nr:TetR/AcrR family transcriptional regulator C-terminal domain-containing protein [Pseudonocardia petroleophila]QNG51060.1 TetR/AcrR family transcriptional regulator C-terminal domain-containing protein [Pseudonocardia petroleophila]